MKLILTIALALLGSLVLLVLYSSTPNQPLPVFGLIGTLLLIQVLAGALIFAYFWKKQQNQITCNTLRAWDAAIRMRHREFEERFCGGGTLGQYYFNHQRLKVFYQNAKGKRMIHSSPIRHFLQWLEQ